MDDKMTTCGSGPGVDYFYQSACAFVKYIELMSYHIADITGTLLHIYGN